MTPKIYNTHTGVREGVLDKHIGEFIYCDNCGQSMKNKSPEVVPEEVFCSTYCYLEYRKKVK